MTSITIDAINRIFNSSHHEIKNNFEPNLSPPTELTELDLVGFLNPIHPQFIQLIGSTEAFFLNQKKNIELKQLLSKLYRQHTRYLVFNSNTQIPPLFLKQSKICIVHSRSKKRNALKDLINTLNNVPLRSQSFHGAVVVVFGQGILITGKSGSGKSQLLLDLLEKKHMWVADDAPNIIINNNNQIIAQQPEHLEEFIHVKNLGVLNLDHNFGKSKRIPQHKLAAAIHLSDNEETKLYNNNGLSAHRNIDILGQAFPQWQLAIEHSNKTLFVEAVAKQLILNAWDENAESALVNRQQAILSTK